MSHSTAGLVGLTPAQAVFGYLAWQSGTFLVAAIAAWRVLNAPTDGWAHGQLSRIAWVATCLTFAWHLGPLLIPVGAIAAHIHVRSIIKNAIPQGPPDPPFAEGTPVDDLGEQA
jgi:hypothetical protein